MELLSSKHHHEFIAFLPQIKSSVSEWQLVDIKLTDDSDKSFTIQNVADLVFAYFKGKEGKIYICNDRELLMLIRQGGNSNLAALTVHVEAALPQGKCIVRVDHPTAENLSKLVILIKFDDAPVHYDIAKTRQLRAENVALVADDDMYMRMLVKKGVGPHITVHDVIHGSEIVAAYKKHTPDILFLDIHMPGKDGLENLQTILKYDPKAYVVMLSSDSSPENVIWTTKHGAKGFLAKPFAKERLQEYIHKCPTIKK